MSERAAIILAGGRAERFQNMQEKWQDKALIELFGKPLLVHAVENVRETVEETVVCVNNENRKAKYADILTKHGIEDVKVAVDEPSHVRGPLIGILTGLSAVKAEYCFILPSDMPFFQPKLIDFMFNSARTKRVVVPMWPNGRLETLTMVLRRTEGLEIARTLCELRRPRSDDIIRGALNVLLVSIVCELRDLDPELKSFININYQSDLTQLQPRQADGPITESLHLNLGALPLSELQTLQRAARLYNRGQFLNASEYFSSVATRLEAEASFFWAAVSRENEGKSFLNESKQQSQKQPAAEHTRRGKEALWKAAKNYESEANTHKRANAVFLAERATSDKVWCESRVKEH